MFDVAEQNILTGLDLWAGDRVAADAHRRIGQVLYDALTADSEGAVALRTVRDSAAAQGQAVTYMLRFPPEAIQLMMLPWELLWDAHGPLLLSRGKLAPCLRYLDLDIPLPPSPPAKHALRILALAPHAGIDKRTHAEEQAALRSAWEPLIAASTVALDELSPVTPTILVDRLQDGPPIDVLHFYGHGRYHDGQGALLFDSESGGRQWLSADRLDKLLSGVRLVVLHACRSAMVSEAGLLSGVASALSAAGVPAVVAMQITVRVPAATRFATVLYRSLARGVSLQRAVGQARQALYVEEQDGVSWFVPTLTIRARTTEPLYLVDSSQRGTL